MRIKRDEAIAVAIDYQEKLVPVMHEKEALIEHSSILLCGLRELGVPTVLTQQYTKGLGTTVEDIVSASGAETFIEKIRFSAYQNIKPVIKGRKYVILCGIEAHICVLQTLIDLKANGYIPVLVVDCISSRKEPDTKVAIQRAISEGAIVTTYESILFELLEEAGTQTSKKIQRLVK